MSFEILYRIKSSWYIIISFFFFPFLSSVGSISLCSMLFIFVFIKIHMIIFPDSNFPKVELSANATAFDPSRVPTKGQDKGSIFNEYSEGTSCPEAQGISSSLARTSSSASSASDRGGVTSTSAGRGLSPSSSVASLSSEKSTLNPNAKVKCRLENFDT